MERSDPVMHKSSADHDSISNPPSARDRLKLTQRATLIGALINSLLALAKILIGVLIHSQSLVADGIHSLSDLVTDAVVLWAARKSQKGPDSEHPYGHGRIETAATALIGIILFLMGLSVALSAVTRLWQPLDQKMFGAWIFATALASLLSKEWLFQYTNRMALYLHSPLLHANAWHHRSDALSSLLVVIGAVVVMVGWPVGDAIAALAVAGLVINIGLKLIENSIMELIDTSASLKRRELIKDMIREVPGVRHYHQLRTRRMGPCVFMDVHIEVDPMISMSEGHNLSETVRIRLLENLNWIGDVTVHVDICKENEPKEPPLVLPLREELLPQLEKCWRGIPGIDRMLRLELHYFEDGIEAALFLPLDMAETVGPESPTALKLKECITKARHIKNFQFYYM